MLKKATPLSKILLFSAVVCGVLYGLFMTAPGQKLVGQLYHPKVASSQDEATTSNTASAPNRVMPPGPDYAASQNGNTQAATGPSNATGDLGHPATVPASQPVVQRATNNPGCTPQNTIHMGTNTWGGFAGFIWANNGTHATTNSLFFRDYGVCVEFVVNDNIDLSLQALINGELQGHWATADSLPAFIAGLTDIDPVIVGKMDWSDGGDVILAGRGIRDVRDFRGKKVALNQRSPSISLLISYLSTGNMTLKDVVLIQVADGIAAQKALQDGQVDIAVAWSPGDEDCIANMPGCHIVTSTNVNGVRNPIIADVVMFPRGYVQANFDLVRAFVEGMLRGNAAVNGDPAALEKAANLIGENFTGVDVGWAAAAIKKARLSTYGDNVNFFNLKGSYKGPTGRFLYMSTGKLIQQQTKFAKTFPRWEDVVDASVLQRINLTGAQHLAENEHELPPVTPTIVAKAQEPEATISVLPLSINFSVGSAELDITAQDAIDRYVRDMVAKFPAYRIQVEGNTDSTGTDKINIPLSQKRAQAVVDYIKTTYRLSEARFLPPVGHGATNPVVTPERSEQDRAKNRRTDIILKDVG